MFRLWKTYYLAPAAFAPAYTRWSRNFLNLGIVALMVSWFFAVGPQTVSFAFADITDDEVRRLERVEGEWLYVGGRNSMQEGIVNPGTNTFLARVSPFLPSKTGPHSHRKRATAHVYPGIGIIQMTVDGLPVLTAKETQAFYRRRTSIFFVLVGFAALMFALSVGRQIFLTKRFGGSA